MNTPTDLAGWLERIGVEHPRGVLRGLDGVRVVGERLGVLPPAPTTIVVAGTNGKGSTTVFAEHLLLAAGRSVGTTTSPHVHVFNERIHINGEAASDAAIVAAFDAVEAARGDVGLSYFEYATLAALLAITRAQVDFAVLEVGLGGRLDAVNAVDADVAVITSIGLDHQQYLGNTRHIIGAEKAGVLRRGRPVVVGEPSPPASVLARARELRAPVYLAGRDFGQGDGVLWYERGRDRQRFHYRCGAIDPTNAATALQAVQVAGRQVDQAALDQAAVTVRNPGRCEVLRRDERTWVLDVAHNPDGARFFANQLRRRFPGRRMAGIVGCLADKDVAGIVAPLKPLVSEFAYVSTTGERGRGAESCRAAAGDLAAFAGSLDAAMTRLARANDVILAFGSFDLVERLRRRLLAQRAKACGEVRGGSPRA